MRFSILSVVLWPKNTALERRTVPFKEGVVNLITGESGSGKSSLTWIVDYCLGSKKCSIPVGIIRDTVDWFSLHVRTEGGSFIAARRNPGNKDSTTETYLDPGPDPDSARRPIKNTGIEDFKDYLNRLVGLPNLGFDEGTEGRRPFRERPSFRDLAAFNFQPQHIVANPFTLFYKADTSEHREKLKTIFPLVVGAIDGDALAAQRELAEIERELKRSRAEMAMRAAAVSRWKADIRSFYDQAVALSLVEPIAREDWTLDHYLSLLAPVARLSSNSEEPRAEPGRAELSAKRVAELATLEDQLARELGSQRRQMTGIQRFSTSARDYERSLTVEDDRFTGLSWFQKAVTNSSVCPVCRSETSSASSELKKIQQLANEMRSIAAAVRATPTVLDKEYADLREETANLERRLAETRAQRRVLEDKDEAASAQRFKTTEIYRFLGRLQQALDSADITAPQGDLAQTISNLEGRARDCRNRINPERRKERLDFALGRISRLIEARAKELHLEHATSEISLDIDELTLRFRNPQARRDYLWEIGSGQNWVGYHIATLLALHEYFAESKTCSVPGFLFIDQPSQVYFPEAWPTIDHPPLAAPTDEERVSTDIAGVHRILRAISVAAARLKTDLQIIVTEHAGEITWRDLENVHVVGNWRDGQDEFLIPEAWYTDAQGTQ